MAPFHLVRAKARREHFPLIYLRNSNIAPFIFKNYKNIYIYTFSREHPSFFYIIFSIFLFNQAIYYLNYGFIPYCSKKPRFKNFIYDIILQATTLVTIPTTSAIKEATIIYLVFLTFIQLV